MDTTALCCVAGKCLLDLFSHQYDLELHGMSTTHSTRISCVPGIVIASWGPNTALVGKAYFV